MTVAELPEEVRDAVLKGVDGVAAKAAKAADVADGAGEHLGRRADRARAKAGVAAGKAGARTGVTGVKIGAKGAKFGALGFIAGRKGRAREKLALAHDVRLKAQLSSTSRELASEASTLGESVDALQSALKASSRAGAKSRTRLLFGIAIGAVAAYHLDVNNGRARRSATAARLRSLVTRSPAQPPAAVPPTH
jgi:hypothetical protein